MQLLLKKFTKCYVFYFIFLFEGTIIRIFNTSDGSKLQELRRGMEYAQIYSLSFDMPSKWLACSSDTGTIHIFNLKQDEKSESKNPKSK